MPVEAPERRTVDQNRLMWRLLHDVAAQVPWPVNGSMTHLSAEDWKDILTASLTKHHRIAEGVDGGFVILGMRTSKMTKAQISDLVDLISAFGAEHGVRWTE